MTTILDVAQMARVSPGTVSNVLTGKRPVAGATRERVLQAIATLGYQPNMLARSLINRRSETLAVVAAGLEFFGPSRTIVGVEREAEALGYSLLLELIPWTDPTAAQKVLAHLAGRQVDGIIWAVPEVGDNRKWLSQETLTRLPPIVFLSMAAHEYCACVAVDNRSGVGAGVRHLANLGRRHIGFLAGPLDWWEARERRDGWLDATTELALPHDPSFVYLGDWSAESGRIGTSALLERHPEIDAILASNDLLALGALQTLHRAGRRIPEDVSVVGFDNMPESAHFWPPLTTVHQDLVEVGRQAVRLLHGKIEGQYAVPAGAQLLRPELIARESTVGTLSGMTLAVASERRQ